MLNICIYGYLTKFLTHNVGVCRKIYYLYDYINHLIDKVMRYSFETKANKIYANKVASYAEEDAAKIIPTKFSLILDIPQIPATNALIDNVNDNTVSDLFFNILLNLFSFLEAIAFIRLFRAPAYPINIDDRFISSKRFTS